METANIPLKQEKAWTTWAGILLLAGISLAAGKFSEFNPMEAVKVLPGVFSFIFTDFLPPAARALPNIWSPLLDTFCMAIVSTFSAAVLSLVLAFLCATPTMPHPAFKTVIRAGASLLRNIPALAWTIMLIPAFGIGKFVGVIALTLGSLGSMTRFFTETIEEIDAGKIDAIRASGGSYWHTLSACVFPQCIPGLISWILYSLELDVRASTIIGMVGGGGIGFYIQSTIKLFRYDQAAMAIVVVALFVLAIEFVSKRIRGAIL